MTHKKNIKNKHQSRKKAKESLSPKKVKLFFFKLTGLLIIIALVIAYSDFKGYFNPSMKNNHTVKKWDAFYDFTKQNNVDILLLGNSHLYTGINPKNLSLTLGANAFILASPGTYVDDSYWGLKEALKYCTPRVVVLETYCIDDFNPYELDEGNLSSQFKSFAGRKDFVTKLESTPFLFAPRDYLYAWSNTIRNHNFLINDYKQIKENLKIARDGKKNENNKKLYLGRYVRFLTGIDDKILKRYKTEGPPVDGNKYNYSEYARKDVNKIISLCKENNIELIFLTLPMYEKHIANYQKWHDKIAQLIGNNDWIDMQEKKTYHSIGFGAFAFENTYNSNQHMTYKGSLLATYKLASFIKEKIKSPLPQREQDEKWLTMFYGDEGYYENYPPGTNDRNCKIICQNKKIRNADLDEVITINNTKNKNKILISKVLTKNSSLQQKSLYLRLKFHQNGQEKYANVKLNFDKFHTPEKYAIYSQTIKPIDDIDVVDGVLE